MSMSIWKGGQIRASAYPPSCVGHHDDLPRAGDHQAVDTRSVSCWGKRAAHRLDRIDPAEDQLKAELVAGRGRVRPGGLERLRPRDPPVVRVLMFGRTAKSCAMCNALVTTVSAGPPPWLNSGRVASPRPTFRMGVPPLSPTTVPRWTNRTAVVPIRSVSLAFLGVRRLVPPGQIEIDAAQDRTTPRPRQQLPVGEMVEIGPDRRQ